MCSTALDKVYHSSGTVWSEWGSGPYHYRFSQTEIKLEQVIHLPSNVQTARNTVEQNTFLLACFWFYDINQCFIKRISPSQQEGHCLYMDNARCFIYRYSLTTVCYYNPTIPTQNSTAEAVSVPFQFSTGYEL
jgi:hypothetical protein